MCHSELGSLAKQQLNVSDILCIHPLYVQYNYKAMQNDLLYDYIAPDSQVESNYTDVMFINEMHKDLIATTQEIHKI